MNTQQSIPAVIRRDVRNAQLPVNYKAAKTAIAECARLDECKDWSDKAAAMATYAKQIGDKSLLNDAKRIILRARERIGELLLEYPKGGRQKIADAHGVSKAHVGISVAIARVPKKTRDIEIDSSPPIQEYALARMGQKVRPRFEPDPQHKRYEVDGQIAAMYRELVRLDPVNCGKQMGKEEVAFYRSVPNGERVSRVVFLQEWFDAFEQALPKLKSPAKLPQQVDANQRYSIDEASALLRQSRCQTYKQIREGNLTPIKSGSRTYIPGKEIIRLST